MKSMKLRREKKKSKPRRKKNKSKLETNVIKLYKIVKDLPMKLLMIKTIHHHLVIKLKKRLLMILLTPFVLVVPSILVQKRNQELVLLEIRKNHQNLVLKNYKTQPNHLKINLMLKLNQ